MNWTQLQGKWDQVRGQIQQKWGRLTDDDLSVARGSRDELVGIIKQRYGVEKEEAHRQVDSWLETMR